MISKYFYKISAQSQVNSKITWLCTLTLLVINWQSEAQVIHPGSWLSPYIHVAYLDSTETDLLDRNIYYPATFSIEGKDFSTMKSFGNGLSLVYPEWRTHYNTDFPWGYNDGPAWKGRGLTTELLTGIQYSKGKFHFTLAPYLSYIQNKSFELAAYTRTNKSEFNYQFTVGGDIDWVQRYGNQPFFYFHTGQSEVRYLGNDFTVAVSTQNRQIGPATQNPILLSQQGPGIPHVELASSRYLNINLFGVNFGSLKPQLIYGLLRESDYYDSTNENDLRYFNSLTIIWMVPGLEGLKFGGSRVFYENMQYFKAKDLTRTFAYFAEPESVVDSQGRVLNDYFDQMASLFFEWSFKESDARFFLEFAKNDFHSGLRDLMVDLEHARAFSFGVDKNVTLPKSELLISFEHTNLARPVTYLHRATPPYYMHGIVRNGYSIDGQLLGAGIGPGSISNSLSFLSLRSTGYFRLNFQRVQKNEDYYIANISQIIQNPRKRYRDTEWIYTFQGYKQFDRFSLGLDLTLINNISRYYMNFNDPLSYYTGISLQYKLK